MVTPVRHAGLNELANLERYFHLSDLRGSPKMRDEFMEAIFNHGLRIIRFMASAPNPGN